MEEVIELRTRVPCYRSSLNVCECPYGKAFPEKCQTVGQKRSSTGCSRQVGFGPGETWLTSAFFLTDRFNSAAPLRAASSWNARLEVRQVPQMGRHFASRIWLWQKTTSVREMISINPSMGRRGDDLNRRPSVPNEVGELHPVHRTRHMDVGKKDVDVRPRFKNGNSFISIGRFNRVKPGGFNHFNCVQADQQFIFDDEDYWPLARIVHLLCPRRTS